MFQKHLGEVQTQGAVVAIFPPIVVQHLSEDEEVDRDLPEEVDPSVQDVTTYHNNLEPQSTSVILRRLSKKGRNR